MHALEKQKDRIELMRKFMKWRLQHLMGRQECKQEVYVHVIVDLQRTRTTTAFVSQKCLVQFF